VSTELIYNSDGTVSRSDLIRGVKSDGKGNNDYIETVNTLDYKEIKDIIYKVEITVNGKYTETMEIANLLVSKYNGVTFTDIPESSVLDYTKEYGYYADANISTYNYTIGDYTSTKKYVYDNHNGLYSMVNIPQWLFVSLFGEEGKSKNVREITVLDDDKFVPLEDVVYDYNPQNYPVKAVSRPAPEWNGLTGSTTVIEYQEAKKLYNQ